MNKDIKKKSVGARLDDGLGRLVARLGAGLLALLGIVAGGLALFLPGSVTANFPLAIFALVMAALSFVVGRSAARARLSDLLSDRPDPK